MPDVHVLYFSSPPQSVPCFLDYAKVRHGGSFHDSTVDEIKVVCKIVLVFASLVPYWIVYYQVYCCISYCFVCITFCISKRSNVILPLLLHLFYDPLSGTTQVSRYQKDKPFWILLKQTWWGGNGNSWTICKLFAFAPEDNHASTSSVRFLWAGCPSWHPTNSVEALKATSNTIVQRLCLLFASCHSDVLF